MSYDLARIGRRIKSGMVDLGLDSDSFAKEIGVSSGTVRSWVSGRSGMSFENAIKIADLLGWSLDRIAVREAPNEHGRQ